MNMTFNLDETSIETGFLKVGDVVEGLSTSQYKFMGMRKGFAILKSDRPQQSGSGYVNLLPVPLSKMCLFRKVEE